MEGFCLDSMLCTCHSRTGPGCQRLGLGMLFGFGRTGMGTVRRVRRALLKIFHPALFLLVVYFPVFIHVGVNMRKSLPLHPL